MDDDSYQSPPHGGDNQGGHHQPPQNGHAPNQNQHQPQHGHGQGQGHHAQQGQPQQQQRRKQHRAPNSQDIANAGWLTLSTDEEILWWGNPSIIPHIPIIAIGVLSVLFSIGATVVFWDNYGLLPLLVAPFGVLAAAADYMKVITTFYVVTDDKVVRKVGIIRRDSIGIRYENIEHSRALQNIWERVFGYGDIELSTAGTGMAEAYLDNVREPRKVAQLINQNKDDAFNAMRYKDKKQMLDQRRDQR